MDNGGSKGLVSTRAGYDRWSLIYDDEDNPLISLEERELGPLLGDVRGLSIVDVGCGTGRQALRLAAAGATVTGLDFSTGMLARARAKAGAAEVLFIEHDLTRSFPLDADTFDRVLCCLVLDHVFELEALFGEMARVCKPDGFVVASVMHPAMMLQGIQARFTDPESGRVVRPESAPNEISDYVMATTRAELRIVQMSEHAVDEELVERSPRARKHLGWPLLLLLKLSPTGRR